MRANQGPLKKISLSNQRPSGKESTEVQMTQQQVNKEENLIEKMKRSSDERHTKHMEALVKRFKDHRCLSR